MALKRGTVVGPYVVEDTLGAGAMGEVYRACDPRLGREVAIKVLAGAHACDPERLRRFELEARATAALTHPNILTIHDIGKHDGLPYLVTELLDGQTLREQLNDGPLAPARTVELGLQLARGVAAAHAVKIVHRDLKPDNLFITADGTLKILDFGLAKLKPPPMTGPDAPTVAESRPGQILGTLGYMAPEQLRGEPIDERADLFAIGTLLYEMRTGRSPFRRASAAETIAAILNETPEAMGTAEVSALERLIRRCLEKERCERTGSARELISALETVLSEPTSIESISPTSKTCGPEHSIAVLPFTDMSPTHDQDYLCDGLAEELINALNHIDGLCVAARSSSFQFRGPAADIRAVGRRLDVATVVEGSVRKLGDRLRVNVQLINVSDGYQRWSQRFDRKFEDVFAIQDEIAESVATSLRGLLSPKEKEALHRPAATLEAYEYFLRGRKMVQQFNRPSIEGGLQMFERAIELDPEYAPGWAGVADANAWLFEWWGGDQANLKASDRASLKALTLGPQLANVHASRGFALVLQDRYEEAASEFEAALKINSKQYHALYYYARAAFAHGEVERSAELFRRAGEAHPDDFQTAILYGQSLRMLGASDDEATAANREGIRRTERHLELHPTDARALSLGASALEDDGQSERAMQWSRRAMELYPADQGVLINGACLRAKQGKKDEALEILEFVMSRGWGKRDWIVNDPDLAGLRDDPRFQALIEHLD